MVRFLTKREGGNRERLTVEVRSWVTLFLALLVSAVRELETREVRERVQVEELSFLIDDCTFQSLPLDLRIGTSRFRECSASD